MLGYIPQALLTGGSGAKDENPRKMDGWRSRSDCGRFRVIFCWSPVEACMSPHYPRIFATYIYGIIMLFFEAWLWVSVFASGKWKAGILPHQKWTKPKETKERYKSPASNKQNSFPHGFHLKMSSDLSLPQRTPVLVEKTHFPLN